MKRGLLLIVFILTLMIMPNVYAEDYGVRELIPKDIKTSVKSENLFYKNIEYNSGIIKMDYIRNNTLGDLKPTVSIGLFDTDRKCIGIIDYCDSSKTIPMKKNFENVSINVSDYNMQKGKNVKDIEYYGVIDENSNCRKNEYPEYYGLEINEIGQIQENHVNDNSNPKYLIILLTIVGVAVGGLFVYNFVFTDAYKDMNGDDTRKAYKKLAEENLKNRKVIPETQPIAMPTRPPVENKDGDVVDKSDNDDTDLTNLYR